MLERRHYNSIAGAMRDVLLDTSPELIPIACSLFLRVAHKLALEHSNMQIGRFMDAAGIPHSTSPEDTKRRG